MDEEELLKKKYYTIENLARHYYVSTEKIRDFIKDGTIKAEFIKNKLLIPKEKFKKSTESYLDWILRNKKEQFLEDVKEKSITTADKIRRNTIVILIYGILPGIGAFLLGGILRGNPNEDFFIFLILVVLCGGISAITRYIYKYLFEKYKEDIE